MKITLDKLHTLKDSVKISWIAEQSGWDRGSLYQCHRRGQDMLSTPNSTRRMRKIVGSLKRLRSHIDVVITYYENRLPEEKNVSEKC